MSTKCISNTMVILMISDNSCHNMEPSWISMTGLSRTYFIIDKIWQIQSRYVINTTLPGVFSIRPVFGLGAVFALGLRPRANTGHLSQIPGRILKTPGNIVYVLPMITKCLPIVHHPVMYIHIKTLKEHKCFTVVFSKILLFEFCKIYKVASIVISYCIVRTSLCCFIILLQYSFFLMS